MEITTASSRYKFGPFELEPRERRLHRAGVPVDLPPKAFDLLVVLVVNNGRLITKDEFLETIWPDTVVEESALSAAVSRLRAALGESAREWRYIETVSGSGYRFTHKVRELPESAREETIVRRERTHVTIEEEVSVGRIVPIAIACLIGAMLAVVGMLALPGKPNEAQSRTVTASTPLASPAPSDRARARAAYDRGRHLWWQRRRVERSKVQFRLALRHDSTYAPALVGLAAAHAFEYGAGPEAMSLLERALELDPDLSTAYATRGFVRMMHRWDWNGAEADLQYALTLDPDNVSALQWLATLRMIQRRPEEADRLLRRAIAVAPSQSLPSLHADRAQALYYAKRMEDAIAANREARRLDPDFWMNDTYEVMALLLSDRPREAAEVSAVVLKRRAAEKAVAVAESGTDELIRYLISLKNPSAAVIHPWLIARYRAALGEYDRALAHVARAVEVHDFLAPFLNADPAFDGLRTDPRFREHMARMGLDVHDDVSGSSTLWASLGTD